jgi:hypothetical protein
MTFWRSILSKVAGAIPSVSQMTPETISWNVRDGKAHGLKIDEDGTKSVVPIGGGDGQDGKDGVTPHIGINLHWWIGEMDTGIVAEGHDGQDGQDGNTPYIGENGNWWIGLVDTGVSATAHYCYMAWRDAPGDGFTLEQNTSLSFEAILFTHVPIEEPQESDFEGLWRFRVVPEENHNIPSGGTKTQKLIKNTDGDYDVVWSDDYDLMLNNAPANVVGTGIKIKQTANENQVFGDPVFINSSGKAQRGKADVVATSFAIGLCLGTVEADSVGNYLINGLVRNDTWNFTPGAVIYLSTTGTAGNGLSAVAPTDVNSVTQILGIAITSKIIYFNPSLSQVEYK